MSIFAILTIGYFFITLLRTRNVVVLFKKNITFNLIMAVFLRMGYFLRLGQNDFAYNMIFSYVTTLLAIAVLLKRRINKREGKSLVFLFFAFVCNFLMFNLFRYDSPIIVGDWTGYVLGTASYSNLSNSTLAYGHYILFLCTAICSIAMVKVFTKEDILKTLRAISKFGKIIILLGFLEVIIKNVFKSTIFTNFCIALFGSSGVQQNLFEQRWLFYTIQGATKEPSMYVTKLFYLALVYLIYAIYEKTKSSKKDSLLCVFAIIILMIVDATMSSIVYIAIILILILSQNMMNKKEQNGNYKKTLIPIVAISFGVVFFVIIVNSYDVFLNSNNYFLNRIGVAGEQMSILLGVTSGGLKYSSEAIRFSGIVYDWFLFLKRPLFGLGIGVALCNSGIITMLCNIGCIGFFAWFYSITYFITSKSIKLRCIVFSLLIAVLPSVILNDFETLQSLVIPFLIYTYYIGQDKDRKTMRC